MNSHPPSWASYEQTQLTQWLLENYFKKNIHYSYTLHDSRHIVHINNFISLYFRFSSLTKVAARIIAVDTPQLQADFWKTLQSRESHIPSKQTKHTTLRNKCIKILKCYDRHNNTAPTTIDTLSQNRNVSIEYQIQLSVYYHNWPQQKI